MKKRFLAKVFQRAITPVSTILVALVSATSAGASSLDFDLKLLAPDGAPNDFFGNSVAIDGNFALVGAQGDDDSGGNSGSAYLFDATSGDLFHKFLAPDGNVDNRFGTSVAVNEDFALIGARLGDGSGTNSGSVYLFDVNSGEFLQNLIAPDGADGDQFGFSVALDGDLTLIGTIGGR